MQNKKSQTGRLGGGRQGGHQPRWSDFEQALLVVVSSREIVTDGEPRGSEAWEWVATAMTREVTARGIRPSREYSMSLVRTYWSKHRDALSTQCGNGRAHAYIDERDASQGFQGTQTQGFQPPAPQEPRFFQLPDSQSSQRGVPRASWTAFEKALLMVAVFQKTNGRKESWDWVIGQMNLAFTSRNIQLPLVYSIDGIRSYYNHSRNVLVGQWRNDGIAAQTYIDNFDRGIQAPQGQGFQTPQVTQAAPQEQRDDDDEPTLPQPQFPPPPQR